MVPIPRVGSGIRQDLHVLAGIALFGKELGLSLDRVVERRLDCGGRKVPIQLDELAVVVVIAVVGLILSGSHRFFEKLDGIPTTGKYPFKIDRVGIVLERNSLCHPFGRGSRHVVSVLLLLLLLL